MSNLFFNKLLVTGKSPVISKHLTLQQRFVTVINHALTYDEYITIPVKNPEDGTTILNKAEYLINNPGIYNLFDRNCGHLVQEILKSIDLNYRKTKSDKSQQLKPDLNKAIHYLFNLRFGKSQKQLQELIEKCHSFEISPYSQYLKGIAVATSKEYEYGHIRQLSRTDLSYFNQIIKSVDHFIGKKRLSGYVKFYDTNQQNMNFYQKNMCEAFISEQRKLHIIELESKGSNKKAVPVSNSTLIRNLVPNIPS